LGLELRPKKRQKFASRRRKLLADVKQRKRQKSQQTKAENRKKARKLERFAKTTKCPYTMDEKILLVGEGDFSFAASLIKMWRRPTSSSHHLSKDITDGETDNNVQDMIGFNLVATSFDSKSDLIKKYPEVGDNLALIDSSGASILHDVDCRKLFENNDVLHSLSLISQHEEGLAGFDKIVFNFPHLGCGVCDTDANIKQHQDLIREFCLSAYKVLTPNGQLLITVKNGEPYQSWQVPKLILRTNLWIVRNAFPFLPQNFPGYQHRRTLGAAAKAEEVGGPKRNADISKLGARTLVFTPKNDPDDQDVVAEHSGGED